MSEVICAAHPALDVACAQAQEAGCRPLWMPIRWAGFLAFRVDDSLSARDKAIMELFYSSD